MLEIINEKYKKDFSKSDFKIMECLMRNRQELQYFSTERLSAATGVSSSTISRFWTKTGFQNFNDLKQQIYYSSISTPSARTLSAKTNFQDSSAIENLCEKFTCNIESSIRKLQDGQLNRAVSYITEAKNIYLFAPDASSGLAEILIFRCRRLGIQFIPLHGGSSLYENMINIGARDLVILFSYSRILAEDQVLLKHCQTVHCKSILFTDLLAAPELTMASLILYSYRGEPSEYHSMAAPMVIIDLLIVELIKNSKDSIERAQYLERIRDTYSSILRR